MKIELIERLRELAPQDDGCCVQCGHCLEHVGDEHETDCGWLEQVIEQGVGLYEQVSDDAAEAYARGIASAWKYEKTRADALSQAQT